MKQRTFEACFATGGSVRHRRRSVATRRHAVVTALLATVFHATAARAQHAADNPVASAQDAFGLTLGLETIGMYSPGQVRGFSPQSAGNVRIDGLYFDQQGSLSNRVIQSSTIRVGLSEIGYAFPAPTGIVDYGLRRATGKLSGAVVAQGGPFERRSFSLDGNVPLSSGAALLPMGVSIAIAAGDTGYTSNTVNL